MSRQEHEFSHAWEPPWPTPSRAVGQSGGAAPPPSGNGCSSKLHACMLSSVSVTTWTVVHQAPLSLEFSKQEYWSGEPFPSPRDLPDPGIESGSLCIAGRFFSCLSYQGNPPMLCIKTMKIKIGEKFLVWYTSKTSWW